MRKHGRRVLPPGAVRKNARARRGANGTAAGESLFSCRTNWELTSTKPTTTMGARDPGPPTPRRSLLLNILVPSLTVSIGAMLMDFSASLSAAVVDAVSTHALHVCARPGSRSVMAAFSVAASFLRIVMPKKLVLTKSSRVSFTPRFMVESTAASTAGDADTPVRSVTITSPNA
jgi:hypothetical protein